jgi:transcription antitermination protein NusB
LGKRSTARRLAMQAVYAAYLTKEDFGESIEGIFSNEHLIDETKTIAKEYVLGIQENLEEINKLIVAQLTDWSFERISHIDRAILQLSTWELVYKKMDVKVVVSEAIELVKKFSQPEAISFVNGILAKIAVLDKAR